MSNIRGLDLGRRERAGAASTMCMVTTWLSAERSQAAILSEHTAAVRFGTVLAGSCERGRAGWRCGGELGEDVRMVENGRHQSVLFLSRAQGRCEHAQDLLILDSLIF